MSNLRFIPRTVMRRAVIGLFALALVVPTAAWSASPARDVVEGFHTSLLAVWQNADSTTIEQRYERLQAPVESAFNLPKMIEIATGPDWKTANEDEQAALVDAFTRYSVANWAARFDSYGGQRFLTIAERAGPGGRTIVDTRILGADEPVSLSYVVGDNNGRAQIVDVVARGVSELARLRAEYRSVLKSKGPQGLAGQIDGVASGMLTE